LGFSDSKAGSDTAMPMLYAAAFASLVASAEAAPKQYAKGFKLGSVFEANAAIPVAEITDEMRASVPDAFDWSTKGATSPVKDQGQCGSCWAFSATETIESAVYMATKQLPPNLAPQQIVSCDSTDAGCNGGNPVTAYQYVEKAGGLDVESDYPYTSGKSEQTGTCQWSGKKKVKVTDWKYAIKPCQSGDCKGQDEDGLKAALIAHGPLSIVVNAQVWNSYSSGVLTEECPGAMDDLDHAVQLVGYDTTGSTPYWKVRNSWATVWGEEGFIRLPMGQNSCGLANLVTYATASLEEAAPKQYAKGFKLGSVFEANAAIPVAEVTDKMRASAPDALDWSTKGATSPVKDQGQCGSCWAFSATETIESAVYMATKQLPPNLAPQQITSCDTKSAGCNGGNPVTAYQYVEQAGGLDVESDYPYASGKSEQTGTCQWSGKKVVKVTDWKYAIKPCQSGDCSGQDEDGLKAALAEHGPLSVIVNANPWQTYHSGVLDGECGGAMDDLDHAVQLVGYDTTASPPYWKVRNSWATVWGEEGFIRLPMGKNSCGLANLVTYATASLETNETTVMV